MLKQTIKTIFGRYRQYFTNLFKGQYKPAKAGKNDFLTVDIKVYRAQGTVQAVLSTLMDYQLYAALGDMVGKRTVEIVQEKLKPIERSGDTAKSFDYKYDAASRTLTVFSDDEGAYHLYHGFSDTNVEALMEWMNYKPEFANLSAKESQSVAFAIRNSIVGGKSPGPKSDLARMPPGGERRYTYLDEALKQLEGELPSFIDDISI